MSRVLEPINIEIGGAGVHAHFSVFDAGVYFAGHGTFLGKMFLKKYVLLGGSTAHVLYVHVF